MVGDILKGSLEGKEALGWTLGASECRAAASSLLEI